MPAPRTLARTVRRAVSQAVDPIVARRAGTLVSHRSRSTTGGARDEAVDALQEKVLADAVDRLRRGERVPGFEGLDHLVLERLAGSGPGADERTTKAVCDAFSSLFAPTTQPTSEPAPLVTKTISDQFHKLYYCVSLRTWRATTYAGIPTYKCPTDMWIYTELIDRIKPALIIETGTLHGGSALYMAHVLDRIGSGNVITVDNTTRPGLPEHDRIEYVVGSSTDPDIVAHVASRIPEGGNVLVILDSDHRRDHVFAELQAYGPLVTPGSYVIVEDGNVNGHPALDGWGPGPYEATHDFLATTDDFVVDSACERYFLTQNPDGYLRRVG